MRQKHVDCANLEISLERCVASLVKGLECQQQSFESLQVNSLRRIESDFEGLPASHTVMHIYFLFFFRLKVTQTC